MAGGGGGPRRLSRVARAVERQALALCPSLSALDDGRACSQESLGEEFLSHPRKEFFPV